MLISQRKQAPQSRYEEPYPPVSTNPLSITRHRADLHNHTYLLSAQILGTIAPSPKFLFKRKKAAATDPFKTHSRHSFALFISSVLIAHLGAEITPLRTSGKCSYTVIILSFSPSILRSIPSSSNRFSSKLSHPSISQTALVRISSFQMAFLHPLPLFPFCLSRQFHAL